MTSILKLFLMGDNNNSGVFFEKSDIILRTASDRKASFVVSGDAHLLGMRKFRRIRIVTVTEMLLMLKNRAT